MIAATLILLVAFGSVIAMGLPIVTALFGLGIAIGVIDLFSNSLVVPTFGTQLAAMIGLGVGVDYAQFIVARYRSALHDGTDSRAAIAPALRDPVAVVLAGATVVVSLLGMMLLGESFVYGLARTAAATNSRRPCSSDIRPYPRRMPPVMPGMRRPGNSRAQVSR